jgi:hypothetical protein
MPEFAGVYLMVPGTIVSGTPDGTSPLMGRLGGGVGSPNIRAKRPPPLIPPHKGEGVDWTIVAVGLSLDLRPLQLLHV